MGGRDVESGPLVVTVAEASDKRVVYRIDDREIFVESDVGGLRVAGDAQAALALIPALKAGRPISLDLPCTPEYEANLPQLQGIFGMWFDASPVEVISPPARPSTRSSRVGSFFSGGVDSFYTALRRAAHIDDLIFVQGFDIAIGDDDLADLALDHARRAAADLGKDLVAVRTNVRDYPPVDRDWEFTHGAAMALVAQSLSGRVGEVLFPASLSYKVPMPWGSHPLTDPLWSGAVTIVHDSADVSRFRKVEYLADQDVAARHLRVCWENRGGRFNCCRCGKCVRTMTALRLCGRLEDFPTFDRPLDLRRVWVAPLSDPDYVEIAREHAARARARGTDPQLTRALEWHVRLGRLRHKAETTARRWARGAKQRLPLA